MAESSLEELEAKLSEYRSSLATVEAALEQDPNEQQLIRLRNDLAEVISLTEDLAKYQKENAEHPIAVAGDAASPPPDKVAPAASQSASATSARDAEGAPAAPPSGAQALVGRTCLAVVNGEKHFGQIVKIRTIAASSTGSDANPARLGVVVDFLGTTWAGAAPPPRTEFAPEAVQILPALKNLKAGTACQAIATEDGKLHSCIIESRLPHNMYRVRFTGLGLTEELKADRVHVPQNPDNADASSAGTGRRAAPVATTAAAVVEGAAGKRAKPPPKEIITPGGYRIPDYLKAKPTDSQSQMASKKRKINLLKKEQKKDLIEEEAKRRQTSWLSHTKRVGGGISSTSSGSSGAAVKSPVGSGGGGGKRESIFNTSDKPEAKVGVTGSGKGMTTFTQRRRHEYDEVDED